MNNQNQAGPAMNGETRDGVIVRFVQRVLRSRRMSLATYGQNVVEHYHARTPAELRTVEFLTQGDAFHVAAINAQKIKRYMDPDVNARLPTTLEEAMVLALPEPERAECITELAARYGLLAARAPGEAATDVQSLSRLTREFGESMQALAPVFADGHIGPEDVAHAEEAIAHLEGIQAAAVELAGRLREQRRRAGITELRRRL